jgi:hypothetical protein
VHDITDLESRGIPAVFVASSEFIEAAKVQSAALGFEPAAVFVQHPIQDRTDEEMVALAEKSIMAILDKITETLP